MRGWKPRLEGLLVLVLLLWLPIGGFAATIGDVNGDGVVDVLDARMCQQHVDGIIQLAGGQLAACDFDGNGEINQLDANLIGAAAVGMASPAVIPNTTKPLDTQTQAAMESIGEIDPVTGSGGSLVFTASTPYLDGLEVGDIMAGDASAAAPAGLLRRVTSIERHGSGIVVHTELVTLEEAIESCDAEFHRELSVNDIESIEFADGTVQRPSDPRWRIGVGTPFPIVYNTVLHDADGNTSTTGDQLRVSGITDFFAGLDIGIKISWFKLKHFHVTALATERLKIDLYCGIATVGRNFEKEIKKINFKKITVWLGPIPLVFSPSFTVSVGVTGELNVGVTCGIDQGFTAHAGLEWNKGPGWEFTKGVEKWFNYSLPSVELRVHANAYLKGELAVLLYGIAGPYVNAQLYADYKMYPLQVEDPWWSLEAGLQGSAGVRVVLFGKTLADASLEIFNISETLAESPSRMPVADFVADPGSGLEPLDVTLDGSSSWDPNGDIRTYKWWIDLHTGGLPYEIVVEGGDAVIEIADLPPGTHSITLVVVDAGGRYATKTVPLVVGSRTVAADYTASPTDRATEVTLDPSGSTVPGSNYTCTWTMKQGGTEIDSITKDHLVPFEYDFGGRGEYTVTLSIVDDDYPAYSDSIERTIQVGLFVDTGQSIAPAWTQRIAFGDLDDDGDPDLVMANYDQATNICWNNGAGRFGIGRPFLGTTGHIRDVALSDVDKDGDLDVGLVGLGGGWVCLNDGAGGFTAAEAHLLQSIEYSDNYALVLEDFNSDTYPDAFQGGDRLQWLANWLLTPTPRFVSYQDVAVGADLGNLFVRDALAVWTGTYHDVLVAYNVGPEVFGSVRLYQNLGTHFNMGSPSWWKDLPGPAYCLAMGDLDGDGDARDFVVGTAAGFENTIYVCTGTTWIDSGAPLGTGAANGIALGDLDNDGDLDAVIAGPLNTVWINDGVGNFEDAGIALGNAGKSMDVALVDLDGDGDLDVGFGNTLNEGSWVFENPLIP